MGDDAAGATDATPYERIYEFENLLWAYRDAARGKRNRPNVAWRAGE